MKHRHALNVFLTATILSLAPAVQAADDSQPKLIVQLTIDQFRSDYLIRFAPALDQGFARILKDGVVDIHGEVDHAITNSAPGHGSLATGSYPASHGYPANEWWDYLDGQWQWVDGAVDKNELVLGSTDRAGYSPINMNVSALGEWITKSDSQSKSVSIGSSEVAIFYAGKTGDHAYWYDREAGKYITSTFFRDEYPAWITSFNDETLAEYKIETWELGVPQNHLDLADRDDQSFESFGDEYTFPHRFADEYDAENERTRQKQLDYWFYETPMADNATFSLAKIAIEEEKLGQRGHTDYLSIALGATDNIGHIYGGFSLEALDMMIHVDRELQSLIDFLDEHVGKNNYVLAVSGDHGAPEPIERIQQNGGESYRIAQEELDSLLDEIDEIGEEHSGSREELTEKIEAKLEEAPFIEDAIVENEVFGRKKTKNPFMHLYRNSWVRGRVADFPLWTSTPNRIHHPARYGIFVQFKENSHFSYGVVVHGSPYEYDRTVPIMFYGDKIPSQRMENLRTIDIAPTLFTFTENEVPGFVDGRAINKEFD